MAATTSSNRFGNGTLAGKEPHLSVWWLSVFAALSVFVLLFVFQRVVHAAVDKAQANRMTQSDQALALWRCNQLPRAERLACNDTAKGNRRAVALPDALVVSNAQ